MALGSTQPLTEMSTRNLPEGKEQPARKADCQQIKKKRSSNSVSSAIYSATCSDYDETMIQSSGIR
jgi:hypothetical protein